jgi:hypothetical protein
VSTFFELKFYLIFSCVFGYNFSLAVPRGAQADPLEVERLMKEGHWERARSAVESTSVGAEQKHIWRSRLLTAFRQYDAALKDAAIRLAPG